MCMIVGDQKAQVLWMEYYCNRLAKMTKELTIDELKQVWNSEDIVTVAAAILSQRQTGFRAR